MNKKYNKKLNKKLNKQRVGLLKTYSLFFKIFIV